MLPQTSVRRWLPRNRRNMTASILANRCGGAENEGRSSRHVAAGSYGSDLATPFCVLSFTRSVRQGSRTRSDRPLPRASQFGQEQSIRQPARKRTFQLPSGLMRIFGKRPHTRPNRAGDNEHVRQPSRRGTLRAERTTPPRGRGRCVLLLRSAQLAPLCCS